MNLVFCTAPAEQVRSAVRSILPGIPAEQVAFIGPSSSPLSERGDGRFISWGDGAFSWRAAMAVWGRLKKMNLSRTILPLNNPEGNGYSALRAFSRLVTRGEVTEFTPDGTVRPLKEGFLSLWLRPEERWYAAVISILETASPLLGCSADGLDELPAGGIGSYKTLADPSAEERPEVSVVIRTYNEEKMVGKTLEAVLAQEQFRGEVIVIDSESSDSTVAICRKYPVRLFTIPKGSFTYGAALNLGARLARGGIVVNLSAHAVPEGARWLRELAAPLNDDGIAAVHGMEKPVEGWCGAFERKILTDSFGPVPHSSRNGHFFSNANAAFPRELLLRYPFDERAVWAEDQIWAGEMQKRGYAIRYQPSAAVYHSHNLSMKGNFARCYRYHRAMFGTLWKGKENEVRLSFRARLPQRSVAFRKFLCERTGMGLPAALFYAPYCEFVNYLGCDEAVRRGGEK